MLENREEFKKRPKNSPRHDNTYDNSKKIIDNQDVKSPNHVRKDDTLSIKTSQDDKGRKDDTSEKNGVVVTTKWGKIRGFKEQVFGRDISTFLGIPYATPPVGSLRFKRTAPLMKPFKEEIDATKFKAKCIQIRKNVPSFTDVSPGMSEDCLYLNIWTPKNKTSSSASGGMMLPVMMWIYGGGFFMGTSNFDETDGRVLSAFGDVVVVTFDYRLGGLGFIDLGTENEAGNQGLYDQLMAIKWVKENIRNFGGDPNQLTLFGESSGAIAIGLHMMSPESSKLFKRAILQSGSPMMTNAFFQRSDKSVPDFVRSLKCLIDPDTVNNGGDNEDPGDVLNNFNINCLRKRSVEEIINVTQAMHEKYFFAFPPTPEEDFFPLIPTDVIKSDEKEQILSNIKDIMIGTNIKGFSYMLWLANSKIFGQKDVTKRFNTIEGVKEIMEQDISHLLNMPSFQINFLTSKLFADYVNQSDPDVWLDRLVEILGDLSFVCPTKILIDELASLGKNVYVYQFAHESSSESASPWGKWMGSTLHDEIPFVFGHPLRYPFKYSGEDIDFSKRIMETWSHFAKTGRPSSSESSEETDSAEDSDDNDSSSSTSDSSKIWPKYTTSNHVFMRLNYSDARIGRDLHESTCQTFKLGFDLLN